MPEINEAGHRSCGSFENNTEGESVCARSATSRGAGGGGLTRHFASSLMSDCGISLTFLPTFLLPSTGVLFVRRVSCFGYEDESSNWRSSTEDQSSVEFKI